MRCVERKNLSKLESVSGVLPVKGMQYTDLVSRCIMPCEVRLTAFAEASDLAGDHPPRSAVL